MTIAFLAWAAFLVATSWVGFGLAEAGRFAPATALGAGAVAAALVALGLRRGAVRAFAALPRGAGVVLALALALAPSLLPAVDTTLWSQDASIHRASGRWLGRTGTLAMPDGRLAAIPDDVRRGLFEMAAVGWTRISQSRLPGGLVVPGLDESVVYPSFAHLLIVWIAIADRVAGDAGIAALGPLFAATAWWAIGLVALATGGVAAALAAVALLASWLPEHWFGRFLMPEILTQALVWSGVAAARLAAGGASGDAPAGDASGDAAGVGGGWRDPAARARLLAGVLCGASLGVAGFARLEQLAIFVPSLLLARGLLPRSRRLLPRGAWLPLALAVLHAIAHLAIVPTDYGKRIGRVLIDPVALTWNLLGATQSRVLASLIAIAVALAVAAVVLRRRWPRLFTRLVAGAIGALLFASILAGRLPEGLPALDWLRWYVPWPAWVAALLGVLPPAAPSGLGLALLIEACDQIVSPRVTAEQVWAARRLVTVVLPLVALAAGWAIARRDVVRGRLRAGVGVALALVAVAIGAYRLAPIAGRALQGDGAGLVREIEAALPERSAVVVGRQLDWLHLAPELWLEGGHEVVVARDLPAFPEALARWLDMRRGGEVLALSGALEPPGVAIDPAALLPPLPEGWTARPLRSFRWSPRTLERTTDRAPRALSEHQAELTLFRLEPPPLP